MKKILSIVSLMAVLVLTGCSSNEIANNNLSENIDVQHQEIVINNNEELKVNSQNEEFLNYEDMLQRVKELYSKVEPNMTKEEVVAAIGEPDSINDVLNGNVKEYVYSARLKDKDITLLRVWIFDRIFEVTSVQIDFELCRDVNVSKVTDTSIDDITERIPLINKNEMTTLDEVVGVLGENYLETYKTDGVTRYCWYDKIGKGVYIEITERGILAITPFSCNDR